MNTRYIPNQAIPLSKKGEQWRKDTIDGLIRKTNEVSLSKSSRDDLLKLYRYYNGKSDPEDYNYILRPYGGQERRNFPAELRTYPLIRPAVDLLVGEKIKRPFNFSCIVTNPDVITVKQEAKKQAVAENMYQWFINSLNEEGYETGMESEEVDLPEHIEEIFERNWKDHRAIIAQNALRYLVPYLHWKEKHQKGFTDFLVGGKVVTHKGIYNNDPFYEVINPVDVYHDDDPDIDFIEDGGWVVIKQLASRSSVVDRFYRYLNKEDIDRLQSPVNPNKDEYYWKDVDGRGFEDDWDDYTEICTVYWKSLKKVGVRTYIDEYGDELEEIVDEGYKKDPEGDIDLQWYWVNEVWQGYRIDGDIYIDIRPHDITRGGYDNPAKVKLPVNGRSYSNRNSSNITFVSLGIPYQISYDIFKYRLESAISRSKDILALMDINLIPENWDMDKFMSILEATGFAWIDYAKEGIQLSPQHQNVLDLSIKTVDQYLNLLHFIKEEWEMISGVTRQRMGEMSQYEGKATSEQSIIQSSHITEDMFRKYSYLEERDLQGILEYAQMAWVDGKKSMYITPDGSEQFLDIDSDFCLADIGVFVSDSLKEAEKISEIKALGGVALEQGAPMSIVASMIDSESFVELKDKIDKVEKMNQQAQEEQQRFEQEMAQRQEEDKQAERDHEEKLKIMDNQTKIEIELIRQAQKSTDDEQWKKELEERKIELQEKLKTREQNEKERANRAKEGIDRKKIAKSVSK